MTRSCPGNGNDSSDSERSLDDPWALAGCDFGVPSCCFCGQLVRLQVCNAVKNKGRKFYKCPNNEAGRAHIFKWWDQAVDEELEILSTRIDSNPVLESISESMRLMRAEIDDLKERLLQKEGEIESLKERLRGWV